jgi:hypothetical protein
VEVGRRSMVPFMAMYSTICYKTAADELEASALESNADHAEAIATLREGSAAMLAMIQEYEAMDKKNWGRQDAWAFSTSKRYLPPSPAAAPAGGGDENPEKEAASKAPWALLDIAEAMVLRMRCVKWMQEGEATGLVDRLQGPLGEVSLNKQVRAQMCIAEIYRQHGHFPQALALVEEALLSVEELDEPGKKGGAIQMLKYQRAAIAFAKKDLMAAKAAVDALEAYTKSYPASHEVAFKVTMLKKQIGADFADVYTQTPVKNATTLTVEIPAANEAGEKLSEATGVEIEWDWVVEGYDVSFEAKFIPAAGGEAIGIMSVVQWTAEQGPCAATFTATEPGLVTLVWDNSHAWARNKSVQYRLLPAGLVTTLAAT